MRIVAESGWVMRTWLSHANPLNDCLCTTIACLMWANKIAFAFELACLPLNWLLDKKCWLAKNSLFGNNYCGGVSHSKPETVKVDLCPTIVGLKLPMLASDTKSISEAWQKLAKTETVRLLAKMRDQYNTFSWAWARFRVIHDDRVLSCAQLRCRLREQYAG